MFCSPEEEHAKPLRIIAPTPTHYRKSTSLPRTSRRQAEPKKVPRPRNAFIIFRCEKIQSLHSQSTAGMDRPATPEKTLSKRAGAAWRLLPADEKERFREMAEQERREHLKKYPDYRYQPNRSKASKPRTSGPPSRREQVESLVMRSCSSAHNADSSESGESACPSPASERSSSPEPFLAPNWTNEYDPRPTAHRRSMSTGHLHLENVTDPYPFSRTYFIEPTSCVSSPGPGPHRTFMRSSTASDRSYSPVDAIPSPNCFDYDYCGAAGSFPSLASHSSSLSLPDLVAFSENLVLDDGNSSGFSTPQSSPATSVHEQHMEHFLPTQAEIPQSSLFHRRQRSNTAPSTISPLTAVATSMPGWNSGVTATGVASSCLPTFSISPVEDGYTATAASSVRRQSQLMEGMGGAVTYEEVYQLQDQGSFGSSSALTVPEGEIDLDRTPRRADFPSNIHTQPISTPMPQFPSANYALQSYTAGLDDLNISAATNLPFELSPSAHSSFDDLDFGEFLVMNNY